MNSRSDGRFNGDAVADCSLEASVMRRVRLSTSRRFAVASAVAVVALAVVAGAAASASAFTEHVSYPDTFTFSSPCTGHQIRFEGTLEETNHVTVDAAGGVHVLSNIRWNYVDVVDTITGDHFKLLGANAQVINEQAGLQASSTFNTVITVVAPGPANNITIHQKLHLTWNANGALTTVTLDRVECH